MTQNATVVFKTTALSRSAIAPAVVPSPGNIAKAPLRVNGEGPVRGRVGYNGTGNTETP